MPATYLPWWSSHRAPPPQHHPGGNPGVSRTLRACHRCRRSCAVTIISPVPTEKRKNQTNGLRKRMRLRSRLVASRMTPRKSSCEWRNAFRTASLPVREAGTILRGERSFLLGGGSSELIKNLLNHPGLIGSRRTLFLALGSFNAVSRQAA